MSMTAVAKELRLSVSQVSCLIDRVERAKDKASYLDDAGQLNCNSDVELAEPQDIGKALGKEPVGQIDAAAHLSFNQAER